MADKFRTNKHEKYSLLEKQNLAVLVEKYKKEYESELNSEKKVWSRKKKSFVTPQPSEGYLAKAVRETFPSLKDAKSNDDNLQKAIQVARRSHTKLYMQKRENEDEFEVGSPDRKKFRESGAGRKRKAESVRQALFDWFVDVRGTLKGRLPIKNFRSKAKQLYEEWLNTQSEPVSEDDRLQFSRNWVREWMSEYGVSLRKPNKRFSVPQDTRVNRIVEFLKNVIRVRYYFQQKYGHDPIIINGDQMPLHRNESAGQKTLTLKGEPTYVKENYMLSRERATVYTQVSSDPNNPLPSVEFVFKGKGTKVKLDNPNGLKVQWSEKGSYRLETMLGTIGHLPNKFNMFTQKDFRIYILDDYSVHCSDEVRQSLLRKGYILIIMGGGITGDIQINDTHVHHRLKAAYRELESGLMLDQLRENPGKIPAPSRDQMMSMLHNSWNSLKLDTVEGLKANFILNALDGSEDYKVSDKLFKLVGNQICEFRRGLSCKDTPKDLKSLLKTITPPEGVVIKGTSKADTRVNAGAPMDEGRELLDCDGDEIPFVCTEDVISSDEDEDLHGGTGVVTEDQGVSIHNEVTPHEAPLPKCSNESIDTDINFLNELGTVLHKYENQTSRLFLPYMCQIRDTYSKGRKSLKNRITSNTTITSSASDTSHNKDGSDAVVATTTSYDESSDTCIATSPSSDDGDCEAVVEVYKPGTYILVKKLHHSLPACVTSGIPLIVQFFKPISFCSRSSNMYQPSDILSIQTNDVDKILADPEIITVGSRQLQYKFSL